MTTQQESKKVNFTLCWSIVRNNENFTIVQNSAYRVRRDGYLNKNIENKPAESDHKKTG